MSPERGQQPRLLAVVGGVVYIYLPALLTQAQELGASKTPATAAGTTSTSGAEAGPMGEVNGAMDVSDALDGGSSSKPRAAVRKPLVVQPLTRPATR